ncbi:helix-turn-helix domain-containing protein [Virgibacillus flavescens]|uniref:helix-turn-helix domain-containing protein n=1 Tax=Virgibacillus flavescens TaxID=1611422 RepID=UPI003D32C3C2
MNDLGRRLENLREKHGFYKKDVSSKLGFSENVYGSYERGERTPSIETVKELSILFETTTDYLITGKEHNTSAGKSENYIQLVNLFSKMGIDTPNFLQMEKWSILSQEDVREVNDHFEWIYQRAKSRR